MPDSESVEVQIVSQGPLHVRDTSLRSAYEPAAQLVQVATPAPEYVPLGHREHLADDASQNMPPSQLVP